MSTSTEQGVSEPAPDGSRSGPALAVIDGRAGDGRAGARARNWPATASVLTGLCGFTVVTILPGLVLGILGLRRSVRAGRGLARSWLGIGASLAWAAVAAFLIPHLLRAADPGCTAYKGPGLTAYGKVIADFNAAGPRTGLARDLSVAAGRFRAAAALSGSPAARQALSGLAGDLQTVLSGIQHRTGVSAKELATLNKAAVRADRVCGTLGS